VKILVVGVTQFVGIHLVKNLLNAGHEVTIATRGKTKDEFGSKVNRIFVERTDKNSIIQAFRGKHFDVVYDTQAYSSNEIKYLLDVVSCERYIETSTVSVYNPNFRISQPESEFDPLNYSLKWCSRHDFGYDEVKRQAECAIFQAYGHVPSVAVRFPLIIGEDDYTKRLYFYIERIMNEKPIHIDNLSAQIEFILSDDAGNFLTWLATSDFCGSINAANKGSVSLADIVEYVEAKSSIKALITDKGEAAPLNGFPDYGLDLSLAEKNGYKFHDLRTRLYELLDKYVSMSKG